VDKRYLNAFLTPKRYNVGGIDLDIFCPRHFITLQAVNSPFVAENPESISYKDLFIALRICSTKSWEDAIQRPNIIDRFKYILIEAFHGRRMKAFEDFGRYMSESMCTPKVWVKDENINQVESSENVPRTLSIVVCLMAKFGFSEEEAWNMPFSRAVWYSTGFAAMEGVDVKLISTEQEEKEEEDLKRLAEYEKSQKELLKLNNRKAKKR
jgi:hypothetical protein